MKTLIKHVQLIFPDRILKNAWLTAQDGLIMDYGTGICPEPEHSYEQVVDGENQYLSPGFVDIHVHGGGGSMVYDGSKEGILTVLRTHLKGGTTTILPSLSTHTHENNLLYLKQFQELFEKFKTMKDIPDVPGIHLEGPYCTDAVVGAQIASAYRDVNWKEVEEYLEIAPFIMRWTAACEKKDGMAFGRFLEQRGIQASIGHSNATLDEVFEAYDHGYHSITHLYSSCSSYHRNGPYREGGIVEAAFLIDDMDVEVIADGKHLPKEFLQLIYKIKGPDHIALITDATRYTGVDVEEGVLLTGDGLDSEGIYIEDGVTVTPDRRCFAGSIALSNRLVRTMYKTAGIGLCESVRMATLTPARMQGLDHTIGSIKAGKKANLLIFDDNIDIKHVFLAGEMVI